MLRNISNLTNPLKISRQNKNPFAAIQNSFNRAIDDFYTAIRPLSSSKDWESFNIIPSVDIVESDDHTKIEVEMPGMGPDDIKIDAANNILTISGEKQTSKQDKDKDYLMREIGYGYYERSIALPEHLDTDKAEASFKKGMLWITIPKKKGTEPLRNEIKIKAA